MSFSVKIYSSIILALWVFSPPIALADQTINAVYPKSCVSQSGTLGTTNFITDFDNGTFGVENGSPDQSPNTDPYPSQISGGVFSNFYSITWGYYAYISNIETPRNPFQHPAPASTVNITDPEFGATGRFFASDPNIDTPTLNFSITNIIPHQNYEIAFWAANSELVAIPNRVKATLDGINAFSTGLLIANASALPWQRYAFVFNAGDRSAINLSMESTETGSGGRDFYIDNITLKTCSIAGGTLSGHVYHDVDADNSFASASESGLANIDVQLWDNQGDSDTTNDIFVGLVKSNLTGFYEFQNIAALTTYELRVVTSDPDLPSSASSGTNDTISVSLASGGNETGNDFGFDISDAHLEGGKSVAMFDSSGYAIPGQDVIYTISVSNTGNGAADSNSIFLVDTLPDNITFYNSDFDGPGGVTSNPIAFSQTGAGLSFSYATDIAYATSGPKPANFSLCNYTPTTGYDENVAYICMNPKGVMLAGTPSPSFEVEFRAQIK